MQRRMNRSSAVIIAAIIVGVSLLGTVVNSQQTAASATDSCSSNLILNGVGILFDTTSLNCLDVWDSQGFILRYSQASSDLWSFVLSAPTTTGYVAIGFSSNGQMVGSSAVVGWISSTGAAMKQYSLQGQTPSQVNVDQGSFSILSSTSLVATQNNRTFVAFQLNTTQPLSKLIYAVGPPDFTPVNSSGYALIQHQSSVSTTINYVSGQSKSGGRPYSTLRRSHGLLNILSWGILMIVGAMVARYFRDMDPLWFYVHVAIQSAAFFLGLIGVIAGLVLEHRSHASTVSTHKGLGIFILVLGCLQVIAVLARPDTASKVRKYWNWYHHNVGRILAVFAVANIFYGIHLGKEGHGWMAGYGVVLAILIISFIALEIRLFMRK